MLERWAFAHELPGGRRLGDVPVSEITREMLGAVITRIRSAGRSSTVVTHVRSPLRAYFQSLIETKALPGPNPAADLKFFVGKRRKKATTAAYFTQDEGPVLIAAAKRLHPRWSAFILTGLLAGLRWGECAALFARDIDWTRGRLHIQRTVSGDRRTFAPCKDGESRHVKASDELLRVLEEHLGEMEKEARKKEWTAEQCRLVFPNGKGAPVDYPWFLTHVWQPLLAATRLPYRRYRALRHTFATWLLTDGADLRWVSKQLGHATIAMTADVYGHVRPERHESAVNRLDEYIR